MKHFHALVAQKEEGTVKLAVKELGQKDLPEGEVLIRVAYSSVNYKDGLASLGNSRVVSCYPIVPGIDLAGIVISSKDRRFQPGDEVIATSYDIGTGRCGGYSEVACVPADYVVPMPEGLTMREAMIIGTAGFTAALSIQRLEDNGLRPGQGPVAVAGATGGVGSHAVSMLAGLGYEVHASTGKAAEHEYLLSLGAAQVLPREALSAADGKPLQKQLWAAAVDPVGGKVTPYLLSTVKYGGSVALSGMTAGNAVSTSVFPFILRGVNLLGIDSVYCPMPVRKHVWQRLASDWKPANLESMINREVGLKEIPQAMEDILASRIHGRVLVNLQKEG